MKPKWPAFMLRHWGPLLNGKGAGLAFVFAAWVAITVTTLSRLFP
ncbi:MAG: hypothetical protein WCT25_03290 [Candidatus Paceibacterota bacterium]